MAKTKEMVHFGSDDGIADDLSLFFERVKRKEPVVSVLI